MPSTSEVLTASGYLQFKYGDNWQILSVQSVNNGLPQPTKLLSVRLVSSTGLTPVTSSANGLSTLTGTLMLHGSLYCRSWISCTLVLFETLCTRTNWNSHKFTKKSELKRNSSMFFHIDGLHAWRVLVEIHMKIWAVSHFQGLVNARQMEWNLGSWKHLVKLTKNYRFV